MGKKHDEIVHSLTKEKIKELLKEDLFGELGVWGINPSEKGFSLHQLNEIADRDGFDNNKTVKELMADYQLAKEDVIEANKSNKDLSIKKEVEKLIIKGEGIYKVTKGYIDIFCSLEPYNNELFCSYESRESRDVVIEVKKLSDFEDTGAIIRQLNEYKEYFNPFDSYSRTRGILWCIYCDKEIPEESKEMLIDEGYKILSEMNSQEVENENT